MLFELPSLTPKTNGIFPPLLRSGQPQMVVIKFLPHFIILLEINGESECIRDIKVVGSLAFKNMCSISHGAS